MARVRFKTVLHNQSFSNCNICYYNSLYYRTLGMNTLLPNSLLDKIRHWPQMIDALNALSQKKSPYDIEGLNSGLYAFFIREFLSNRKAQQLHYLQYKDTGRYSQAINTAANSADTDVIIIVPSEKEAQEIESDLRTILSEIEIHFFPWWGIVPYRPVPKGALVFGERAAVLAKLAYQERILSSSLKPRVFIITQRAILTPVPPPDYIRSLLFSVKCGQEFDPTQLADRLVTQGYTRVPRVTIRGEFTLRGEVLDIFMPGEEAAHRIVFDFNIIDHIKTFDPETQSSLKEQKSLLIYPMKEVIWTDQLIKRLESAVSNSEKNSALPSVRIQNEKAREEIHTLLADLCEGGAGKGEELFYPLIFPQKYTILEYMSEQSGVFFLDYDRLENAQESIEREYLGLYRRAIQEHAVPVPSEILFPFKTIESKAGQVIRFRSLHTTTSPETTHYMFDVDQPRSFFGNINYLKETLTTLQNEGWIIYLFADSENQALRLSELFKDFLTDGLKENSRVGVHPLQIIPSALSSGFGIPSEKILVIQENEIFGRRKRVPKSIRHAKSAVIDTFVELNPGDYIVHVNYGIGRFKGIERIKALGNERDYIKLEYAEAETVFIPIEQVNLIQRYIGNEGDTPRLDRLGSKSWENRKNKVKKSVEDIAQRLIDLYSRRQTSQGFAFPPDTEFQTEFEAAFPYEETEDQLNVTAEVKSDMEKPIPMDRLICGDVGYGKTEIAMRAAFKAAMGGKQVALLAPTTILAEQHFESFSERFNAFKAVSIAHMSRFVSRSDQKEILKRLAAGQIDILIGTHRIIQKDVIFKDLGLLIIDEEQRFGVKDKERLKELKANIDCLAMSATPIPRTLHMSMLKIRDMSLLTTPPSSRQPIETVVDEYNNDRIAAAIRREVERGGQVFYLHNRVETLDETRIKLERLVPEMMIDTAHGKMTATELDDIFRRFKMGGFHVLVATTIIENGIDIPNVNTIIIDRADMYGVSQLYQLRGRVGRSDRKAYAYLFYPENKSLSDIAMKRLQVISDFTELGAGFKIAMKDMEIRGAGNLLGKDQSGEVYSVGFDLYLRLLEEAVQRLSTENYQEQHEVLLELEYTGFIPDNYISNPQIKMEIYKKIAAISDKEELDRIYSELQDRFGPVPEEVSSLLALADIRIICKKLMISSLRERNGVARIEITQFSAISSEKFIRMAAENAGRVQLEPNQHAFLLKTGKIGLKEKSEFIREKLEILL